MYVLFLLEKESLFCISIMCKKGKVNMSYYFVLEKRKLTMCVLFVLEKESLFCMSIRYRSEEA